MMATYSIRMSPGYILVSVPKAISPYASPNLLSMKKYMDAITGVMANTSNFFTISEKYTRHSSMKTVVTSTSLTPIFLQIFMMKYSAIISETIISRPNRG